MKKVRRALPLLLAGLGALAVAGLWLGAGGSDGGLGARGRGGSSSGSAADLEASGPAPEAARGPRLEPAPGAAPRASHGPVTVRVVDAAGRPVGDVRVEVFGSPSGPERGPERGPELGPVPEPQVADAGGFARFADLPYDGRASVRALARTEEEPTASAPAFVAGTRILLRDLPVLELRMAPPDDPEPIQDMVEDEPPVVVDSQEAQIQVVEPPPPGLLGEVVVDGPEVWLVVEAGLPLSVEVREGGLGRVRRDAPVRLRPRVPWEAPAVGPTHVAVKRGKPASIACRVQAPEGWIARKEAGWEAVIHPLAERLVAVYPLRPALEVIIELPEQVMPYRAEDWNGTITVAGIALVNPDLHVDGLGHLHVRGGAHVVGDQVTVEGTLGTRFEIRGTGHIGPDARAAVRVRAEVTDREAKPADPESEPQQFDLVLESGVNIAVQGNSVRLLLGRLFTKVDFQRLSGPALAEMATEQERLAARRGGLSLRVVSWNGAPAAGARLRWGEQEVVADAQGRVRLEGVVDGPTEVTVLGAGAPTRLPLEVGAAPRAEMTLAVPQGGTLEVEVVDSEGRALPFAHVDVTLPHDLPHMDCVDGVQRIDPYTDAAGRRTYRFLTPGQVKVQAYFGTRNVETLLEVVDGATQPVRLVLPVHAPPAPPAPTGTSPARR